jgi:hypothetical protein
MSVKAINIKRPPVQALSAGVAEALKSAVYSARTGAVVIGTDTLPATLFNVPKYVRIEDIKIHTTTALTGADPDFLVVGTTADTDMFHSSSDAVNAGTHSANKGDALYAGGRDTSTGSIQVGAYWSKGSSAGAFWVEMLYNPFAQNNFADNP